MQAVGFRVEVPHNAQTFAKSGKTDRSDTHNIGALRITYTILGVPDYSYSTLGPKTLF